MKTHIYYTVFLFLYLFPLYAISQYIVIQEGDKVEVRNINGGDITSGFYSGVKDIAQGENFIVLWYESDKVEIRSYDLKYLTSAYYSNVNQIGATKDWVIIHYENGKIEVRDKELKYYSSWFK
jgi:hypothetical protein